MKLGFATLLWSDLLISLFTQEHMGWVDIVMVTINFDIVIMIINIITIMLVAMMTVALLFHNALRCNAHTHKTHHIVSP